MDIRLVSIPIKYPVDIFYVNGENVLKRDINCERK